MPSSRQDAAGESTIMFLPVCLWQGGVGVPGLAKALAKALAKEVCLLVTRVILGSPA